MSTTIPGTSKDALLAKITQGHRAMREALGALSAERWEAPLPSGWTLKEVAHHLGYWESTVPPYIEALRKGGREPAGDVDELNARTAAEARTLGRDEVLRRWDGAHAEAVAVVRGLSENELADERIAEKIECETYGHYPEHYDDVGFAIHDKDDLIALVQTPWVGFRLALGAIGLPGLERQTPTGWTYKDVAAHAAAWEDLTAERLRAFRESGGHRIEGVDDADAFNADVVERTRGRSGRDVLLELDAAHDRMVAEIEKLTPGQIHADGGRIASIVAGNSYGHYAEHFDEIYAGVPKRPAELIERMREGWRPFRRSLARLGFSYLSEKTPAGWTYKGMLGHLANWMEKIPAEMPNRLAGRRGPAPDVDAENRREADTNDARSAHEVVERLDNAYRGVVDLVNSLPPEGDIPFGAIRLVVGETYAHFVEHGAEVDAAVPRTAADYIARLERVWKPVRAAIRDVGRAGLDRKTPAGRTYKEFVAHAIGWMDQAAREIKGRDFPPQWTSETIDAFNARSVRSHQLVGAEAILDELDTAYRRLLETVRGLSEADLADDRIVGGIVFYNYHHWEEHFDELGIHA